MASGTAARGLAAGSQPRLLTQADGAAVVRLAGQLGYAGEPDHWRQRLEPSGHGQPLAWGLEVDGRLAALLLGHTRSEDFGISGEVAWLESLGVHPASQGYGLARVLAEAFFEDCARRGISRVATLVHLRNQPLWHFFHALGFRQSPLVCLERRV